jgi:hypothetical protein
MGADTGNGSRQVERRERLVLGEVGEREKSRNQFIDQGVALLARFFVGEWVMIWKRLAVSDPNRCQVLDAGDMDICCKATRVG